MGFTDARKASHTQGEAFTIRRHLPPKENCIPHGARVLPVGALQCGTGRRAPKSLGIPTTHRSRTPRRPDHQRCPRRKAQCGFTVPSGVIALSVKGAPHPLARANSSENSGTPAIIGFSRSAPPRKSINGFCTRKNLSNGAVWWSNRGDFLPAPSPLQGSCHPLPLSGSKKLH